MDNVELRGNMPDPISIALALASMASSIGGGYLAGRSPKETKNQRTSRKTADELLASLKGDGPYSDLFQTSEDAFKKSYVDPSLSRFRNQIAPQIQQEYIYGGQQRGTGLEDQLLRAGVDMDQLLNEQYMNYIQNTQNRASSGINSIIGMNAGAQSPISSGQQLGQATGGYLSSPAFRDLVKDSAGYFNTQPQQPKTTAPGGYNYQAPIGFSNDWGIGDRRWGSF